MVIDDFYFTLSITLSLLSVTDKEVVFHEQGGSNEFHPVKLRVSSRETHSSKAWNFSAEVVLQVAK